MANKKQDQKEKRNAKGGGSVRQRPDGRWEARCTINGKTRSFYADKQAEALKLMRDAQKAVDDQTYIEPSKLTVGQWLDIWLEEYHKPTVKPSTYRGTSNRVRLYIKPELGDIKLQKLAPPQIQKLYNSLIPKICAHSIKIVHANLHSALKKAVDLGYLAQNPTEKCTKPKKEKKDRIPLSSEEISLFLNQLDTIEYRTISEHQYCMQKEDPFKNLFKIALFTGMRIGEVSGLTWDCVDFKNETITIRQQLCDVHGKKDLYYIGSTKNGKTRILNPPSFVMELLKDEKKKQLNYHLQLGLGWENKLNLVFTMPDGSVLERNCIRNHLRKIASAIGRPDLHFHDLRHTYTVLALQEGDTPKTVQEALGHATANFTLEVYAHVTEKMKKESAERMQNYYEKLQG